MPAGLVNQLLACHWAENGTEMEERGGASNAAPQDILESIRKIRARPKPQFNF